MVYLQKLETELKKRWEYPYKWGRKQSDDWDYKTNFIYNIIDFKELEEKIKNFDFSLKNYALNRWYNFVSAMGVEYIFSKHPLVTPNKDPFDKLVDFLIHDIPFDHKTSIFPKGFYKSIDYAFENKKKLIEWLYFNQSQQGRKHLKNRLFVIVYDKNDAHWKMKAELFLIKNAIDNYLQKFDLNNLLKLKIQGNPVLSDIIWVTKK